jgi:hypothetical protein
MLRPLAALPRLNARNGDLLARFDGLDRRHVAIVVTSDGRRVQVPVRHHSPVDPLLDVLRSLRLGLEGLLGLLITGSRREDGRTRRDGR